MASAGATSRSRAPAGDAAVGVAGGGTSWAKAVPTGVPAQRPRTAAVTIAARPHVACTRRAMWQNHDTATPLEGNPGHRPVKAGTARAGETVGDDLQVWHTVCILSSCRVTPATQLKTGDLTMMTALLSMTDARKRVAVLCLLSFLAMC